jgi:hypothetical protein
MSSRLYDERFYLIIYNTWQQTNYFFLILIMVDLYFIFFYIFLMELYLEKNDILYFELKINYFKNFKLFINLSLIFKN